MTEFVPGIGSARSYRLASLYLRAAEEQHALARTMREIGELLAMDGIEGTDRLLGRVAARRTERENAAPAPSGPSAITPQSARPEPSAFAAKVRAMDRILDAYTEKGGTTREIAAEAGVSIDTVSVYLSRARKVREPRVAAGDAKRAARSARPSPAPAPCPRPEPERRLIPVARPVEAAPAPPAPPAPAIPVEFPQPPELPLARADLDPSRIMAVDVSAGIIHGPGGAWKTAVNVARAMARLVDGGLYGHDVVARAAGFDPRADLRGSLMLWRRHLDRIGLRLVEVPKIGVRVGRV